MEPDRLKIVVFGAYGVGKTTLIRTLDPESNHIEALCAGGTTTIALDYGRVEIGTRHVYLFGTPGQERFEFAREIIGRGMDGAILVVDATSPYDEFVAHIHDSLAETKIPFIIMMNKCDKIGAHPESLKNKIRSRNIVQASAIQCKECLSMLIDFVATIPPGNHGHDHIVH
jgi:small GTP-binding protein